MRLKSSYGTSLGSDLLMVAVDSYLRLGMLGFFSQQAVWKGYNKNPFWEQHTKMKHLNSSCSCQMCSDWFMHTIIGMFGGKSEYIQGKAPKLTVKYNGGSFRGSCKDWWLYILHFLKSLMFLLQWIIWPEYYLGTMIDIMIIQYHTLCVLATHLVLFAFSLRDCYTVMFINIKQTNTVVYKLTYKLIEERL